MGITIDRRARRIRHENLVLFDSSSFSSIWLFSPPSRRPTRTRDTVTPIAIPHDPSDSAKIFPDDPRYTAVVEKRFNKRFIAKPDYVRLVSSAEQVVAAVQDAVDEQHRLVVTSGGHCLESFASDADARVVIDVSPMKLVYYDAAQRAIAIEGGVTVGEAFRALFEKWGVVVPFGEYPEIGIGGHVSGGAFGFLCREYGLAVDYLYAVEVVTVDKDGRAKLVLSTREANDPNRELWWAHTGGGAGNFGVVTRYLFRSSDATGDDPATLLPKPPALITTFKVEWSWADFDEASVLRLLQNHGVWCEHHSAPNTPNLSLWALLQIHRQRFGKIFARGLSTSAKGAELEIAEHVAALSAGVPASTKPEIMTMSWLDFALNPFPELFAMPPGGVKVKVKDAMIKKRFTDAQIRVAYKYLTSDAYDVFGGAFGFATYGGRVNAVALDATAAGQRSTILDTACNTGWVDPKDEAENVKWAREFYREMFAATGGVPVPNEQYDGTFINHPDVDLLDPEWNSSGVPWSTLYYQSNYPRLQRAKAEFDPRNVYRHALSIRAAG
jgi:aclacinomycin oxidase